MNEGFTALTQLGQTFVIPCCLERDCLVKEVIIDISNLFNFGVSVATWGRAHGEGRGGKGRVGGKWERKGKGRGRRRGGGRGRRSVSAFAKIFLTLTKKLN